MATRLRQTYANRIESHGFLEEEATTLKL